MVRVIIAQSTLAILGLHEGFTSRSMQNVQSINKHSFKAGQVISVENISRELFQKFAMQ
ncbi:unnamed protein product [Meloidogyne enterolobii]|uniref:Uncharacterized protein n=1 Tax=Meloidogyne enterolobii TaxID=390850 RepID=A0ACB0ZFR8_MELEN